MKLHPFVGNKHLRSIAPFGPVTMTHTWPRGFDSASWQMEPGFTHPELRAGARVVINAGGNPLGRGIMSEPGTNGEFHVTGTWREAVGVASLTSSTTPTTVPDTAIDQAIARAAVGWTRPATLSSTAWSNDPNTEVDLVELLDKWAEGAGLRWFVDERGAAKTAVDPTVPMWHVPHAVAGRGLTLDESGHYGRIYGRYLSGVGVFAVATAGSSPPEAAIDLIDLGVITSTRANAEVQNRYLLTGARRGWASGLTLSSSQITTPGGTPAPLSMVQAGQMIRLHGVLDSSRDSRITSYIDVVIAKSTYTDGQDQINLEPMQFSPRNLLGALAGAMS